MGKASYFGRRLLYCLPLFSSCIVRRKAVAGAESDDEAKAAFILEDLQKILTNIQLSTMGTESKEDFDNLFEDIDLNNSKLGRY